MTRPRERVFQGVVPTIAAVLIVHLWSSGQPALAVPVTNADPPFTADLPDGFVPAPQVVAANPKFVQAFQRTDDDGIVTAVVFDRMGGTIDRKPLDPKYLPPGSKARLLRTHSHGFAVDEFEVPEQLGPTAMVNYNVQVPLKPSAVQLRVIGRQDHAAELQALTDAILANLNGDTNWLPSASPPSLAESPRYTTYLVTVMAAILIVGLTLLWLLHRRAPRGTALAVAVLVYLASYGFGIGISREAKGAIGITRLTGFLGILIGAYDLFRHPTPNSRASVPPPLPPRAPAG